MKSYFNNKYIDINPIIENIKVNILYEYQKGIINVKEYKGENWWYCGFAYCNIPPPNNGDAHSMLKPLFLWYRNELIVWDSANE